MSYAQVAAPDVPQSPEEARAAPVPQLESHEDLETSSLVDVDSPHVSVVPSTFETQEVKTETQAERREQEAEAKARAAAAKANEKVQQLQKKAATEAKEVKEKAAAEAKEAKAEIKAKAKETKKVVEANSDNPVFIVNYVLWGLTIAGVSYGAYKKHSEGALDIQLAGKAALALGALGAADYYVSKYLVQNKYPVQNA